MNKEKWFRLDNAAKVFPSVSSKRRTNLFRISMTLVDDVNPFLLQEALELVLPRFSALNTTLHHGAFWYYLDKNDNIPQVYEETPQLCKSFKRKENNGFLFRFYYYQKRISIEVFHALTDGTGALELLKSVVFTYLTLNGKDVSSDGLILTDDIEERFEEQQDSFVKNYDPNIKVNRKEDKALQIRGTLYDDNYLSLISGTCDLDELKKVCKEYSCTVNQFITSGIIYAASRSSSILEKDNKPFQVFIPVNLRRYFPSKTMRNFSLYIRTKTKLSPNLTFSEIVESVKKDVNDELNKDKLQARIAANVKIEKNFFMRIAPLFIKEIAMKIGYNAWGETANSFSISNLGIVELPDSMKPYISDIMFSNGASYSTPVNLGVVTYNGKIKMTFLAAIIERNIQKEFFRLLSDLSINITIDSNEVEV